MGDQWLAAVKSANFDFEPLAQRLWRSRHDVDATVDEERLACHPARVGRRKVSAGEADIHDVDQLADRRSLHCLVEHEVEIL